MQALIVVDIQYDFLPGGALAVPQGDKIIPIVNQLMTKNFHLVVATQDWHPADHASFAVHYQGKKPGDLIALDGIPQVLWPVHCVQHSPGASLSGALRTEKIHHIFQKGTDPRIDSYSGFFDNGHKKATGLDTFLKGQGIKDVYIVGLAGDYCVKFTALDAVGLGYGTYVFADATKGVNLQPGDLDSSIEEMRAKGVQMIESGDF